MEMKVDEFYIDLQSDGRVIDSLTEDQIHQSPFPGLRPFRTGEFSIFKGRESQVKELLKKLQSTNFLAVIGSSGTGKSSLIRAGLIPDLFAGFLSPGGSGWDVAICRPGGEPINNLAVAFSYLMSNSKKGDELIENYKIFFPLLANTTYGVLNATQLLRNEKIHQKRNLLIIVDQFEELFRYEKKINQSFNEVNHFVKLLLNAARSKDRNIYVIITMRSEFLGDTVKYKDLPEAINAGQYLVPQLTAEDLWEVIEEPIERAQSTIDENLTQLLINEIQQNLSDDKNLDYLPLLQHALMRTYEHGVLYKKKSKLLINDYQEIGEMNDALNKHAESVFLTLQDNEVDHDNSSESNNQKINPSFGEDLSKKQLIAKILFQALTDISTDLKGGRRPTDVGDIYEMAKSKIIDATDKEVEEVVNVFRQDKVSFITPGINVKLTKDVKLDICHESLMRHWPRLEGWMDEELKAAELYRRLNERRELHDQGKEGWLDGGVLADIVEWEKGFPHTLIWAKRYHLAWAKKNKSYLEFQNGSKTAVDYEDEIIYNKNLRYITQSANAEDEKKRSEIKRLTSKKVNRVVLVSITILIVIIVLAFVNQIQLTNLGFQSLAVYDIDKLENKEMTMKILIAAYNNFDNEIKDSLIIKQKKATEEKLKSVFINYNFSATKTIRKSGFQPLSWDVLDNGKKILVSYKKKAPPKPIKIPNTISIPPQNSQVINNQGFLNSADSTILYSDTGKILARYAGKAYPIENSSWVCVIGREVFTILNGNHIIKTDKLPTNVDAAFLRFTKSPDNRNVLAKWSPEEVQILSLRKNLPSYLVSSVNFSNKNHPRNRLNPYYPIAPSYISGQFLSDNRVFITYTYWDNSLNLRNDIAIFAGNYPNNLPEKVIKDVGQVLIAPLKNSVLFLKNNNLLCLRDNKLVPIHDTISNKSVRFDLHGNFIVYNYRVLHAYKPNGQYYADWSYFDAMSNNYILDFQNDVVIFGKKSSSYAGDSTASKSKIRIYNLRSRIEKRDTISSMYYCFLSNNADTLYVQTFVKPKSVGTQIAFSYQVYILSKNLTKKVLSTFALNNSNSSPIVLIKNRHSVTNSTDDVDLNLPSDLIFHSFATSGDEIKIFDVDLERALNFQNVPQIIDYFNKTHPDSSYNWNYINEYLHTNSSWLMKLRRNFRYSSIKKRDHN